MECDARIQWAGDCLCVCVCVCFVCLSVCAWVCACDCKCVCVCVSVCVLRGILIWTMNENAKLLSGNQSCSPIGVVDNNPTHPP